MLHVRLAAIGLGAVCAAGQDFYAIEPPEPDGYVALYDIADDGSAMAGALYSRDVTVPGGWVASAVRWTRDRGIEHLPVPGGVKALAAAVSGDGRVFCGTSNQGDDEPDEAWQWSEEEGLEFLPRFSEWEYAIAHHLSTDGSLAVVYTAVFDLDLFETSLWRRGEAPVRFDPPEGLDEYFITG